MLAQMGEDLAFLVFYTSAGKGADGLTVTATVYDPDGTAIVVGVSAVEVGLGLYRYTLDGDDYFGVGLYTAVFHTDDTPVDRADFAVTWGVGIAGVENLDAPVSSRADGANYTYVRALGLDNLDYPVSSRAAAMSLDGYGNNIQDAISLLGASLIAGSGLVTNADTTATETGFDTNLQPGQPGGCYNGCICYFTSGGLQGEARQVVSFADALTPRLGFDPGASFTSAPADDDSFVLLPAALVRGAAGLATYAQVRHSAVTITSPVLEGNAIELVRGDDYLDEDGRALHFYISGPCPDLTDAAVSLELVRHFFEGEVIDGAATPRHVMVELTAEQTSSIGLAQQPYALRAGLSNGHSVTLLREILRLLDPQ